MRNKITFSTQGRATPTYVAESERDAERLRETIDAPVRVRRGPDRVTVAGVTIEGIGLITAETSRATETPGMPAANRRPAL